MSSEAKYPISEARLSDAFPYISSKHFSFFNSTNSQHDGLLEAWRKKYGLQDELVDVRIGYRRIAWTKDRSIIHGSVSVLAVFDKKVSDEILNRCNESMNKEIKIIAWMLLSEFDDLTNVNFYKSYLDDECSVACLRYG
jgi:hypothetical protein